MVLSIGEILVDIFVDGKNKNVFAGGAPFNVASNIAHYGQDVAFYGAVGKDEYGAFLKDFASHKNITLYLDELDDKENNQALVTLENGERSFKFIRDNGADYNLDINHLKTIDLSKVNIAHIGSLMLSLEKGRSFFKEAVKYFKDKNIKVSLDVNYRDDIFANEEEAKEIFLSAVKEADIIKFTEEELTLLTNKKDVLEGLKMILNENQIAVITLGSKGSIFYDKDKYIHVPTKAVKPIDTTGAGDAFYSYFLYALSKEPDFIKDEEKIKKYLLRANVAGGLTTLKKGAIDSAPNEEEITDYLNKD